ncbi:MAG TPA: hypothetical protein VGE52_15515, partial [Pirellulales bacterium]
LSILKRMVAEGVFGPPDVREKIVLGVCYTGGDNSEKEFLAWASQVNSPAVVKRLKAELKQRT